MPSPISSQRHTATRSPRATHASETKSKAPARPKATQQSRTRVVDDSIVGMASLERAMKAIRPGAHAAPPKRTATVFAIDGGGVFDVRVARVLEEIEKRLGHPISQSVNLAAMNSGGTLACAPLIRPNPLSAHDTRVLFQTRAAECFPFDRWYSIRTANGLFGGPRYPATGIERVIKENIGDALLSQASVDTMIMATDWQSGPRILTSFKVGEGDADYYFRDAIRASSSVPGFFPPPRIKAIGSNDEQVLVDGGLWANNPALYATLYARLLYPNAERLNVISFGTGKDRVLDGGLPRDNQGLAQLAPEIIDLFLDTNAQIGASLTPGQMRKDDTYLRINPPVITKKEDAARGVESGFDDGSPENMARHVTQVEVWIKEHSADIDKIVELLRETHTPTEELKGENVVTAPKAKAGAPVMSALNARMLTVRG